MKKIIVYYSLEGNTEYVADKLSDAIGAGKLRLIPEKAYVDKGFAKFIWGGKSAVMAEKPKLKPYALDTDFGEIIIGFPVWAANIAPPYCQGGSGAEKAFGKLRSLLEIDDFYSTAVFIDPKDRQSEENKVRLDTFIKKLKEND